MTEAVPKRYKCRSCGSQMVWGRLNTGEWVPLDPEPDRRGQMILLLDGERCHPVDPTEAHLYAEDVQARRHWNHLTTCGIGPGTRRLAGSLGDLSGRSTTGAGVDPRRERLREIRRLVGQAGDARPSRAGRVSTSR